MRSPGSIPLSILLLLVSTMSIAEDIDGDQSKIINAQRVDSAPIIDGKLDDVIWKQATVIEDLHQVSPHEYTKPSKPTLFYLMYDKDAIYLGVRAWDNEPEKMSAQILKYGSGLRFEDRVGIILDPFNDKLSGYMFEINPNGVRLDGLFTNPTKFSMDWDGIWYGDSEILEDGYTVEFAIPFKTLSFAPENDTWGFNVFRQIMRTDEKIGWVSYNRNYNPAASGELSNLKDMDIGMGLDIIPSMSMRKSKDFNGGDTNYNLEPSLDIFYKFTPDLNGSFTYNTDFSATEIDDRQVDLSRFNLFFPEKRSFFLKDSEIFEFGNIGGDDSLTTLPRAEREDGRPFFSRSIGLSDDGNPVDLDVGAKLSGRIGQWNVGTLAIRQAEFAGIDATDIFVGRVSRRVLNESSIGAMVTYGDPTSNLDNMLGGVDFRYLNTNLPGGRTIEGEAWYQKTHTQGISGDDAAWGMAIRMPNRNKFRGRIGIKELQENYNPGLGFANRLGVRDYVAEVGYTHRPTEGLFREIYGGIDTRHVERLSDGGLQTQWIRFRPLQLTSFQGDNIEFRYALNKEGLDNPFEISDGITLPTGLYTFNRYGFLFDSSQSRKISVSGGYFGGDFFNGKRIFYNGDVTWRPNKHIGLSASYTFNDIDLAQGNFITRLMTFQSDIVLSNAFSITNLVQYDNVSNKLGFNMRTHWAPEAGQDVFFVINYNLLDTDEKGFVSDQSDITLKASYTFRF